MNKIKRQIKIVNLLKDIADKLCLLSINKAVASTRISVSTDGSIPAGVTSYKVTNLGPTGDGTGLLSFTFDGDTIPNVLQSVNGAADKGDTFPELLYIVNGNTLFIEYTTVA